MAFTLRNILNLKGLLLTASLLAVLSPASPARSDGFYAGLTGGLGQTSDSTITGTGINTEAEFEPGGVAALSLGYSYKNALRSEIELSGRWSDADSIGGSTESGDVRSISAMVNALYDVSTGSSFTPYLGIGLGAANVEASGLSPVGGSTISGDDTALAYQGILGISYKISDSIALNADYRYFGTRDLDFATANGTSVEQEYTNHAVLFGIRVNFGGGTTQSMPAVPGQPVAEPVLEPAPEAPPEPEPVTASAATEQTQVAAAPAMPSYPTAYRVLFDWNSAVLDDTAMAVIREAARNALAGNVISISASGHADRSGTEKNNMKISKLRAEAVKTALVENGILVDYIAVDWHGESQPVLDTKDGVREVQNRRTDINFAEE